MSLGSQLWFSRVSLITHRRSILPCPRVSPYPVACAPGVPVLSQPWPQRHQSTAPACGTPACADTDPPGSLHLKIRGWCLSSQCSQAIPRQHFCPPMAKKKSHPQSNQPVSSKGMGLLERRVMICPWSYCYLRFY